MRNLIRLKERFPVGTVFGNLTVRGYTHYGKPPYFWMIECVCSCGQHVADRPHRLAHRRIRSCGCTLLSHLNSRFVQKFPVGLTHGNLVVVGHQIEPLAEKARTGAKYERRLVLKCTCGNVKSMRPSILKCCKIISCGCVGRQRRKEAVARNSKTSPEVALNTAYSRAKVSAGNRGLIYNLSLDEFSSVVAKNCQYCGSPPSKRTYSGRYCLLSSGIDRIDSKKGYILDNCVPCCKTCNYAKRNMSVDQFTRWITQAYLHQVTDCHSGHSLVESSRLATQKTDQERDQAPLSGLPSVPFRPTLG